MQNWNYMLDGIYTNCYASSG